MSDLSRQLISSLPATRMSRLQWIQFNNGIEKLHKLEEEKGMGKFIRCTYIDEDGTSDDKQCTREEGHEGAHSIPIRIQSGQARIMVESDLERQRKKQGV